MKKIILSYILIISLLSGCASNIVQDEKQSKGIEGDLLQLKFFQVSKVSIKDLDPNNIGEIINEKKINDKIKY